MKYINPVIKGFYPDPSVCAANGYFYLVCSSFQYFPALPLFRSRDMIRWEQIGHCITRKSQLDLNGCRASGGIFAPTIRYNNGRFYVVVTNTDEDSNFYIYTDDIEGEWSDPVNVNRGGIDPSLLFDGDKTYFMSNGEDDFGESGVSLCEIDIETGKILSPCKCICKGTGGRFIEAPHLYHIGDYYYLLVAEGGTEYGHTECLFRSREPFGEYESCPHNPVLTNRGLGGYPIQGAGHADIVCDKSGQWWMVNLAFRQISRWRQFHHLGREVFLEPVYWQDDDWFKVGADGTSRIEFKVNDMTCTYSDAPEEYPGEKWKLDPKTACYIRCPNYDNYRIGEDGTIGLKGTGDKLNSNGNVTFIGDRQHEFDCTARVNVCTENLKPSVKCGLTAYMDENNHFDLAVSKSDSGAVISGVINIGGIPVKMNEITVSGKKAELMIKAEAQIYKLYGKDGEQWRQLAAMESKYLSSEVCEGFTGVIIGIFCEDDSENADFVSFIME
ncbi:MAG TPA: glycoside hydrolase family 43 protein [Ruminococcaceae bacterium]|nr:glycoside hydrolase family 43 protein [Oscillospiraceae bacterium]